MADFFHHKTTLFLLSKIINMTNGEKMRLIEEALELDENALTEETILDDIVQYDSMGKLSLIVLCDDEFDKKLTGEQINSFKTVKDILDFMD
jgi:acyl carrier protein